MLKQVRLVGFLILTVGGGFVTGALTGPDAWFTQLHKPAFIPPSWIFAPVWSVLYVMIAVAGWRVWERRSELGHALLILWALQLILNFAWSPVFFVAHRIGLALIVIAALLLVIVCVVVLTWHRERIAAVLFTLYGMWVGFATALNVAILLENEPYW